MVEIADQVESTEDETIPLPSALFCIVCTAPIPQDRIKHKSVTCSKQHGLALEKFRRALMDERRCRHCFKPSTPEERKQYRAWALTEGHRRTPGRPVKTTEAKDDTAGNTADVDVSGKDDAVSNPPKRKRGKHNA